jgi:hypothetical protein
MLALNNSLKSLSCDYGIDHEYANIENYIKRERNFKEKILLKEIYIDY